MKTSNTAWPIAAQNEIIAAEAKIRELEESRDELLSSLNRLIVSANTVDGCYTRNPGNFASALAEMKLDAKAAQKLVTAMEVK